MTSLNMSCSRDIKTLTTTVDAWTQNNYFERFEGAGSSIMGLDKWIKVMKKLGLHNSHIVPICYFDTRL